MARTRKRDVIPPQEAVIVEALASGADPVSAVALAGHTMSPENAKVMAKHVWKNNVDRNSSMVTALEEVGVSPVTIAQKLKDKMDAKTLVPMGKGEIVEVDDHSVQLKATDMMLKVVGGYAATKTAHVELKFEEILIHIDNES